MKKVLLLLGLLMTLSITFPLIASSVVVADSRSTIDTIFMFYGPLWDVNHDGVADYIDASLLVTAYNSTGTPHWIRSDMTGPGGIPDGDVNYLDVSMFVDNYGEVWLVP